MVETESHTLGEPFMRRLVEHPTFVMMAQVVPHETQCDPQELPRYMPSTLVDSQHLSKVKN